MAGCRAIPRLGSNARGQNGWILPSERTDGVPASFSKSDCPRSGKTYPKTCGRKSFLTVPVLFPRRRPFREGGGADQGRSIENKTGTVLAISGRLQSLFSTI